MIGVLIIFTIIKLPKKLLSITLFVCSLLVLGSALFLKVNTPTIANSPYSELSCTKTDEFIPLKDKTVYLTFDDGPSKKTLELLDILEKYDVKATFFVIGKEDEKCKKIVKTLYDKGHTVAPHTYCHVYSEIYCSVNNYLSDFEKIYNYVYDITGEKPTIFRFPGGSRNSVAVHNGIMNKIVDEMDERGLVFHDWNIVSGDDTPTVYPAQTLFNNVLKGAKKTNSPVILFHDTDYNKTTPEAVELVIKHFKEQGYSFDCIKPDTKPIQFAKKSYA